MGSALLFSLEVTGKGTVPRNLGSKNFVKTSNQACTTRTCETLKLQNMDENGCYV
jgi:hypothetical protein